MWDEISGPFSYFNGKTVEVMESISNFIPHLMSMWLIIHDAIKVNPC